jgi:methylmalonyl-CoA/ethylmalonyl-CoA epimerase
MIMDGSGFGLDGDGHYAYLDTEAELGVTLELIQRPKGRMPPEKIFPPEIENQA